MFLARGKRIAYYIKHSWWQLFPQTKEFEAPLVVTWHRKINEHIPAIYLLLITEKQKLERQSKQWCCKQQQQHFTFSISYSLFVRASKHSSAHWITHVMCWTQTNEHCANGIHAFSYHMREVIACIYVASYGKYSYRHDFHAGERSLNPGQRLGIAEWRLSLIPQYFQSRAISTGLSKSSQRLNPLRSTVIITYLNKQHFLHLTIPKRNNLTSCSFHR
jgi:hypothetical protein